MPLAHLSTQNALRTAQISSNSPIGMNRVAAIILGGGQGTRLFPLTMTYCKPAACIGGKYRLIDIPLSNAIHSGCSKIFIVTQFLATSLHQHVLRTYQMGSFSSGFIEFLSAEQRPSQEAWYKGTADAIRQNLEYLTDLSVDYFLILSGDQLYNMDFQHMLRFAKETDADLVIASLPVAEPEAKRMGLLKINEDRFITEFYEKPQEREILDRMRIPEFTLKQFSNIQETKREYLGSMGIYLFKRQTLIDLLQNDRREDFGKHLIPTQVSQGKVAAYLFDGYWEDIGTIGSFFEANMAMTSAKPPLDCYNENKPIFFYRHHLPAPRISRTQIDDSLICEGSIVEADSVKNSILGPRTIVRAGSLIRHSYIMGNDYYSSPFPKEKQPNVFEIGENCLMDHAIIDKHVHIGKGVHLVNKKKLSHFDSENVYIRDGIIIVPRGAHIPDGFIL